MLPNGIALMLKSLGIDPQLLLKAVADIQQLVQELNARLDRIERRVINCEAILAELKREGNNHGYGSIDLDGAVVTEHDGVGG
jgi:hypothetical protein